MPYRKKYRSIKRALILLLVVLVLFLFFILRGLQLSREAILTENRQFAQDRYVTIAQESLLQLEWSRMNRQQTGDPMYEQAYRQARQRLDSLTRNRETGDTLNSKWRTSWNAMVLRIRQLLTEEENRIPPSPNSDSGKRSDALTSNQSSLRIVSMMQDLEQMKKESSHLQTNLFQQQGTYYSVRTEYVLFVTVILLILFISLSYWLIVLLRRQQSSDKKLLFNTALLNNLYDPVITTDRDFIITDWNDNASYLFGYQKAEVMGLPLRQVLQTRFEEKPIEEIRRIIREETRWNGNLVYHKKSGEPVDANVSTSLILDEKGLSVGTVSIIRDISELRNTQRSLQALTQQLEESLGKNIQLLQKMFEQTTDSYVYYDNQWNYVHVNDRAARFHQSTPSYMIGRNIREFMPHISSVSYFEALQEVKAAGRAEIRELHHPKTGQWFENHFFPEETGISVFYREITKRKHAEKQLLDTLAELGQSNERFELISKAANDILWDWNMNTQEVWGNDKYQELVAQIEGYSSNFEAYSSRIHPEDVQQNLAMFERLFQQKNPYCEYEYRFQIGDEWRVFYNRTRILYNETGTPVRMVGSSQDITDDKKVQDQILEEKEILNSLISSLPGLFYMFDRSGRYVRWNKNMESITEFSEEEIRNGDPLQFVPVRQREELIRKIQSVFTGGADQIEADLLTKSQKRIPYLFTGKKVVIGQQEYLLGVGIDVSERERTQRELRELATHLQNIREEERARISREIHDELGQQLTGLKMDLSWLRKHISSDDKDAFQKVIDSMELVDKTVVTVRRISTQLRPGILDDLGLVSAMEWEGEEFQKRYGIPLIIHNDWGDLTLDKEKSTALFRIYQESLTNVLRHAQASQVDVFLEKSDTKLFLSIHDNGIGFDEKAMGRKKTLGILGMKERTIMLGGTYVILGEKGQGTTVTVELPVPE